MLIVRQNLKCYVTITNMLIFLYYLIYAFSFPVKDDQLGGDLFRLYQGLMLLEIIVTLLAIWVLH
jgi:hypothetical protein